MVARFRNSRGGSDDYIKQNDVRVSQASGKSSCTRRERPMKYDVCVIGHVTKDIVETVDHKVHMPGGTVYYTAIALKNLGLSVAVITKLSDQDTSLLSEFSKKNIPVFLGESGKTTTFMNVYSKDTNTREQRLKEVANPFTVGDASLCEAKLFHLGPLTQDDIPLEVIQFLATNSEISLDVQGFVRRVSEISRGWSQVIQTPWKEKIAALAFVNILKANDGEARTLSNQQDLKRIATELSSYGPDEVIITCGSRPSLVYSKGKSVWIPAYPPRSAVPLDPTGCGDTYMAGYLFYRGRCTELDEVGKFAAMTASLKLEQRSPFRGSEKDVRDFAFEAGQPLARLSD